MSEKCTNNCDSCNVSCGDRENNGSAGTGIEKETLQPGSRIRKTIGIISGKGGVGKSLVTGLCAKSAAESGKNVAIIDGDITGPSIPKMFGINKQLFANEKGNILPAQSKNGIKMVSINLMLENPTDPVVWRGPVIADVVKQFWNKVDWGHVDYMFIDMPPGTGDVALTAFQSLPVDGIIIVTTPQDLVSMIVEKAVKMAEMMKVPILGLVENMAYATCPCCNEKIEIFGPSKLAETAKTMGLVPIASLPVDSRAAQSCDKGELEEFEAPWVSDLKESLNSIL